MPNTLAHIGVGGAVTRAAVPHADLKWIYLGCVIPDVPWILQRVVSAVPCQVDPYALRIYCISQASLAGCLLLAGALAIVSYRPWKVFSLLAANCLIHLLLDASQTKWGNGVHFFAPFSWQARNFTLFWPESIVCYLLTGSGLVCSAYLYWRHPGETIGIRVTPMRRSILAAACVAGYLLLPTVFADAVRDSDSHFVKTLSDVDDRPGRYVEFDRAQLVNTGHGSKLHTFFGEVLAVTNAPLHHSASVSIRGVFLDKKTVMITDAHVHASGYRQSFSLLGLALVTLTWFPEFRRLGKRSPRGC